MKKTQKNMKLTDANFHPSENVRSETGNYDYENDPTDKKLYESIKAAGLIDELHVSVNADGSFKKLLKGYRRLGAILSLAEREESIYKDHFPLGNIPCFVYKDLTAMEELTIMADHTTGKGLSEEEVYKTVELFLVVAGTKGIERVSAQLGINKKTLYKYRNLHTLASKYGGDHEVEGEERWRGAKYNEWRKVAGFFPVTWTAIGAALDACKNGTCKKAGDYEGLDVEEIWALVQSQEKPVKETMRTPKEVREAIALLNTAGDFEKALALEWVMKDHEELEQ